MTKADQSLPGRVAIGSSTGGAIERNYKANEEALGGVGMFPIILEVI